MNEQPKPQEGPIEEEIIAYLEELRLAEDLQAAGEQEAVVLAIEELRAGKFALALNILEIEHADISNSEDSVKQEKAERLKQYIDFLYTHDSEHQDFNKHHPEMREGEVLYTNLNEERDRGENVDNWSQIPYASKRMGEKAYSRKGTPLADYKPVFVQRKDLEDAGVDPDNFFTWSELAKDAYRKLDKES